MDSPKRNATVEPLDEDGGFTMDFSIDVVEDIPAQVEEMMSLAARGYFKLAREISDNVLVRQNSIFNVAVERMRLLHDQGDFEALLAETQTVYLRGLDSVQIDIFNLMEAIACHYLDKPLASGLGVIIPKYEDILHEFSLGYSWRRNGHDNAAAELVWKNFSHALVGTTDYVGYSCEPSSTLMVLPDH
jgi:hypothetical protein